MESAVEEILREILLRLPTRAVAVGRCVCRQWRGILTGRSFLDLHAHAAHVVSGAGAEGLLISQTKDGGYSPVTKVFNVSTGGNNKFPMCVVVGLDGDYTPANACNGFLCLAATTDRSNPVFVCNPITGEKLPVEPPPIGPSNWHMYAMGYSPATREYKLFGLSFSDSNNGMVDQHHPPGYMYALTLDAPAGGDWRLQPALLRCQGMRSPPALIDGKLYLLAKERKSDKKLDRLLVVDVASETHRMCRLPAFDATAGEAAVVDVLELHGRPCVAVQELGLPRRRLRFWVLSQPASHGYYKRDQGWDLRHSSDMGVGGAAVGSHAAEIPSGHPRPRHHPRAAWIDGDGVQLCYMYGGHKYNYGITDGRRRQNSSSPTYNKDSVWDHQLRLSPVKARRWDVFGGSRPMISPPRRSWKRSNRSTDYYASFNATSRPTNAAARHPRRESTHDSHHDAKFQYLLIYLISARD